jgi:hypothetical protein
LNHRIAVIICLLCSVFGLSAYSNSIPSNEDIAEKLLVETAVKQVYLHANKFGTLVFPNVRTGGEYSALSEWMQQSLIDNAISADYSVYLETGDPPDSAIAVEITGQNITFEYESIGNKWLFFNKGYKRSVKSGFHISIREEKNGKVLLSQQFSENFEDTVSNIAVIEDEKLTFTKGKKLNTSLGKRLIEPVLITAATITMVYLFYSLRSGK